MDISYSVDMLRLKVEVPVKVLEEFILKPFEVEPGVKYKFMTSISSYRHNFFIEDLNLFGDKCSYWIGASHNSRKQSDHTDIVLEYNPNKCVGSVVLCYILEHIYINNKYVEVKSLDVAIDIPCNILDISYSCMGNMSRRIFDNGSDDRTYYFRKGKSNGAIKIYNKKRESKLDYELTRYEITLTPNICISDFEIYSVPSDLFVPISCIGNYQVPIDIKGVDKVLMLACMDNPEYLKELDRRKRKKIEQLLAENCSIDFDFDKINFVVRSLLKSIYTL